jgi:hypothetical protein
MGRALAPTRTDDSRYRSIQEHALAFHIDEKPPNVSHFIAGPFQTIVRERVMMTTIFRELSRQNNYIKFSIDS